MVRPRSRRVRRSRSAKIGIMFGNLRRSFQRRWDSGHRFSAMVRLLFTLLWLPYYVFEVLDRSDLGTLARFVSPIFGVTVQLIITAWLFAWASKFFKLGGWMSGEDPTTKSNSSRK
jgi:hypothetical protein